MLPFNRLAKQSGMTLVETMIASTIAMLFTYGGYQMLGRTQKYLAMKKTHQLGRTEAVDLAAVLKKDWDYRMFNTQTPLPVVNPGFKLLTKAGGDCLVNTNCPTLKLWIKRANAINEITVQNICVTPDSTKDKSAELLIRKLDFNAALQGTCSICPFGQVPAVQLTGIDINTKQTTLKAENRIFPNNVALNQRQPANDRRPMLVNDVLGMQACFQQTADAQPLNLDVRSFILATGENKDGLIIQTIINSQVFAYENFANIRLEQ